VCRGLGIDHGVYPTDRALLLYYKPQQQCHLLIIGLHSLVAVLFLFTAPLPQQSLLSPPLSIPDDRVHNIDTYSDILAPGKSNLSKSMCPLYFQFGARNSASELGRAGVAHESSVSG